MTTLIMAACAIVLYAAAVNCVAYARRRRLDRRLTVRVRTEQLPLGDLVISPAVERYAAFKAACPTEAIGCPCCTARDYRVSDCSCREPCGWAGCQATGPWWEIADDIIAARRRKAIIVSPRDFDGLGTVDPDPRLGRDR